MSQTPDPTDAKADGNFGSAGSHRTGYANDKLANAEYWARKGGTLNAGEGAILCEEIDRLRATLYALREPSEAMVKAVDAALVYAPTRADVFRELIRRAVEAAEQEATREVG